MTNNHDHKTDLPAGWVWTTVEDVCTPPQYGYTTKAASNGTIKLLRTTDITSGRINWDKVPFCSVNPNEPEKYLLQSGDIVISRAGSVGVSYLIENPKYSVFASYLIRFNPLIYRKFFKYFLDSPYYWKSISEKKLGIAIPNVNASKLKTIEFPLPPLAEQHRIVDKIEELFSDLDHSVAALKTARQQLDIYRQAVLKYAFEGKLTEPWRQQHQPPPAAELLARIQTERAATGKSAKSLPPLTEAELAELPSLPEGWVWVRLGAFSEIVGGVAKGRKLDGKETINLPYLRVANVQDGYLDLSVIKRIDVLPSDFEKYRLELGDILYTEGGDKDKLGRGTVWKGEIKDCIHQNHVFRARAFQQLTNPSFIAYFSQTQTAKKYFFRNAKQTVNLASINMTVLSKLPVPIPSFAEQQAIVEEIEARLSVVDKLAETIDTALKQAEALRQSILKQAFAGKLVPQHPDDEPAEKLLERIKTQKSL